MNKPEGTFLSVWIRRHSRAIALACMIGMAPVGAGCYGRFPVTHAVYNFNGEVSDNGFIQSVLMWVFIIIPVYSLAMLGDAVIFNLIEFWTGDTIDIGYSETKDGRTVTLAPSEDGREAVMTVREGDQVIAEHRFVKVDENRFEVRDSAGQLAGMVLRTADGDLQLTDNQGTVVRTISAGQLATIG